MSYVEHLVMGSAGAETRMFLVNLDVDTPHKSDLLRRCSGPDVLPLLIAQWGKTAGRRQSLRLTVTLLLG